MNFNLSSLIDAHNSVSIVNIRVYTTLAMCIATCAVYLATARVPADSWLIWLATMSGMDFGTFWAKRSTFKLGGPQDESANGNGSTASTDIQEQSKVG